MVRGVIGNDTIGLLAANADRDAVGRLENVGVNNGTVGRLVTVFNVDGIPDDILVVVDDVRPGLVVNAL